MKPYHSMLIFICLVFSGTSYGDKIINENYLHVERPNTVLYEEPDYNSPVIRQLYYGEILNPVEEISTLGGYVWIKVKIGNEIYGYIPASKLEKVGHLPENIWTPTRVIRNEKPLSLGLRMASEVYGAALNIRYLPFARLGLTFSTGPVIDDGKMQGTALSFGVLSTVALTKWSPVVETGFSRFSYHDARSTLRISSFYLSMGAEWISNWGGYINFGFTYVRSLDIEVIYELEDAKNGNITIGNYGRFDDLKEKNSLQEINPFLTFGYSF